MKTEDILAIQQEIARYSYTFDSGDAEGWANIFEEDGCWEFYASGVEQPIVRLEGHSALRDFCSQRFSERRDGITSYHHQSGIIFDEVTLDTARVKVMLIITVQVRGEQPLLYMTGIYHDQWVKTTDGWKIKYRVLRP